MSLSAERDTDQVAPSPVEPGVIALGVATGVKLYAGGIVLMNSSGYASKATAATSVAVGRCRRTVDNTDGSNGDLVVEAERGVFNYANSGAADEITIDDRFTVCYVVDDQTVAKTNGTNTRARAGFVWDVRDDGSVDVKLGAFETLDLTAVENDVSDLTTDALSAKAVINLPILSGVLLSTGVGISAAAPSGAAPGTAIADSKSAVVKWLANATPGAFCLNVPVPADLDDTATVVFHALVSKSGATVGDAVKLTVAAFENVPAALHDADVDFGGDTGAVVGNAAAKTVTELTLTFAAADIHAYAESIALQIKVKAGTLGTDNCYLHAAWLEYTRKLRTS